MADSVVTRWESDRSVHEWTVGGPAGSAGQMARGYIGYEEWPEGEISRREVARNGVALILSFGEQMEVRDNSSGAARSLQAFVVGNQSGASLTRFSGHQQGVQVELTSAGALSLFGDVSEINDRAVPLEEAFGGWGSDLVERLGGAAGWEDRFGLLDGALGDGRGPELITPEVMWLERQLLASRGRARVEPLMDQTGWSRRLVTERFRRQIGVGPKAYARVLRFRRAVDLLGHAGARRALAEIAMECGYYDQSHFTRDFVALAGCTPTEYRSESVGRSSVRFVQDGDRLGRS